MMKFLGPHGRTGTRELLCCMGVEVKLPLVENTALKDAVRRLITQYAKLSGDASQLGDAEDLYEYGMTSHSSVMLMLGLENEFGVEFPDSMLTRDAFSSVDSITSAINTLQQGVVA